MADPQPPPAPQDLERELAQVIEELQRIGGPQAQQMQTCIDRLNRLKSQMMARFAWAPPEAPTLPGV
jgi:hypothetical protein